MEIENTEVKAEKTPLEIAVKGLMILNDVANVEINYSYLRLRTMNLEGTVYGEGLIETYYSTGEGAFSVDLKELLEVLKIISSETLELVTEKNNLYIRTEAMRTKCFIDYQQNIPELDFRGITYFMLERGKQMYDILSSKIFKNTQEVILEFKDGEMKIKNEDTEIVLNSYGSGESKITVDSKYLREIFRILRNMKDIVLEISKENVLIISYGTLGIKLKYYIAPVIA